MPGASWMTFPWVRELKFTKKYWQCLVRVLEICWRCIRFASLGWRTGVVFLWDRNPNRTWSQWEEEQKEHPWNDGFGGVVVTHSFRPAGLGTERRVKLTHGGFYGCGTIRHPSISIYRPPKQKFRQIKLHVRCVYRYNYIGTSTRTHPPKIPNCLHLKAWTPELGDYCGRFHF